MSEAAPNSETLMGLLIVDKPLRRTSMDVCADVRARLRRAGAPKRVKVGHAGTLDPMATGVLVVLVGRATRLCDRFMASRKRYMATVDLSAFTTTDDVEGARTEVACAVPSREAVDATIADHVGVIQQRPPAFSAVHVAGRRAYDMARRGEQVDLPPRPVVVHGISVIDYSFPRLVIDVWCGKGTYIRSLARDIGRTLGTGGTLASLRRTASGRCGIDDAVTLDALPRELRQADLRECDAWMDADAVASEGSVPGDDV